MCIVFGRKTNQIQEGKKCKCVMVIIFAVWVFFLLFDFASYCSKNNINIPQIIRIILSVHGFLVLQIMWVKYRQ